jgi:hypothetical protein
VNNGELTTGRALAAALVADLQRNPYLMDRFDRMIVRYGSKAPAMLVQLVIEDVESQQEPPLFPNVRDIVHARGAGMAQWGAVFSTAITALSQAASTIYQAKVSTEAAEKVAEIQAATQRQETAARQAEAEAQEAAARGRLEEIALQQEALRQQQAAAAPVSAPAEEAGTIPGTGIPILPVAIAGGAALFFFVVLPAMRRKKS